MCFTSVVVLGYYATGQWISFVKSISLCFGLKNHRNYPPHLQAKFWYVRRKVCEAPGWHTFFHSELCQLNKKKVVKKHSSLEFQQQLLREYNYCTNVGRVVEGSKKPRAVKNLSPALHEVLKAQYESLKCVFFFFLLLVAQLNCSSYW